MHRLMIFIDGSNLYHETDRYQKGLRIDFEKLRDAYDKFSRDFDILHGYWGHRLEVEQEAQS